MGIESIAASAASATGGASSSTGAGSIVELGAPGSGGPVGPAMEAKFQAALDKSGGVAGSSAVGDLPGPMKGMFKALDGINVQAKSVSDYARTAEATGGQLTPGEIVQLTMKCQEFMFQCQLTSNIANRSSDGVQQLFKQQG